MNLIHPIFFLLILLPKLSFGQEYTIKGYLKNAINGEPLVSGVIYSKDSMQYAVTNTYGFYSIIFHKGNIELNTTYLGCKPLSCSFYLRNDTTINFILEPELNIGEVLVKAPSATKSSNAHIQHMQVKQINNIPAIGSEPDVLRAIQYLPGIQGGSEGSVGLHVRGGDSGQNLYLLDGVPVYNPNHMFGFFSVFNPDAINNIRIIKGGFSAKYGGRLSSIIDIKMKDGNDKHFGGNIGVGLIASKVTLEGPLVKNRTSFVISTRRTYVDLFTKPIVENFTKYEAGNYYFYDLSAKINHKMNDRSSLSISWYHGKDNGYSEEVPDSYANYKLIKQNATSINHIASLRWSYRLSNKLFGYATCNYSKYISNSSNEDYFQETEGNKRVKFSNLSEISNLFSRVDFDYYKRNNHISFGFEGNLYCLSPDVTTLNSTEIDKKINTNITIAGGDMKTREISVYFEDKINFGKRLNINIGIRYSAFYSNLKTYNYIEPRLLINYAFTTSISANIAYTQMNQSLHLLTLSKLSLTSDLWLPSTNNIKPQHSQQFSSGLTFDLTHTFSINTNAYFKTFNNLTEYAEGASFFRNFSQWDDIITQGDGESYGLEILVSKNKGRITGHIGYTIAKSDRMFSNINFGKSYPYQYDRRHVINIILNYKISEKFSAGAVWVFNTGNYVTLPLEKYFGYRYEVNGAFGTNLYLKKNSYQLPASHHLDLSIRWIQKKKKSMHVWAFSIYNVYNKKNIYFVDVRTQFRHGRTEAYLFKKSLFPILPTLSYTYTF